MKDYYKILEIEPNATIEQVKSQYHLLVHAWHPDKFPDDSELKNKAEAKIRDINEAFSILSNPIKREEFNRHFHATNRSSPQNHPPNSERHSQNNSQEGYCQICGAPAEVKYVEFHENVGMIIMRQHRVIKGKLCKSCINYYFWSLTGKTMLLGWWGAISLVITPFILMNNIIRFIYSLRMRKPINSNSPKPSPFWVFSSLGGALLSFYLLVSFIVYVSPNSMSGSLRENTTQTPFSREQFTQTPYSWIKTTINPTTEIFYTPTPNVVVYMKETQTAIAENDEPPYLVAKYQTRDNLVIGPLSGKLINLDDDMVTSKKIRGNIADFVLDVVFENPALASLNYWDYGIIFRDTNNNGYYALIISSESKWLLIENFGAGKSTIISEGEIDQLNLEKKGGNHFTVLAIGENGYFFINNILVSKLDLLSRQSPGDLSFVTGYFVGNELDIYTIPYTNGFLWQAVVPK